jgi:hypothetical protein
MNFTGGFEIHVGRYIDDCWALEAVYWRLKPNDQFAHLFASDVAGNVDSPFDFDFLEYDNGTGALPAGNYFDDAQVLRIVREYEYNNVELNLFRRPFVWTNHKCRPVRFGLLAGVRYMQVKELIDFDADVANDAFGDDMVNELFYGIEMENHLVGLQAGGQLDYCLANRLSLNVGSKLGIYGNHIKHRQSLWGGAGNAVISAASPLGFAGSAYGSDTSKNHVAFIGELVTGLSYDLNACWRVSGGYRAVVLSGVALPTGQIPTRFDDLAAVDDINSSDCLVLHGAYAGLEFNW